MLFDLSARGAFDGFHLHWRGNSRLAREHSAGSENQLSMMESAKVLARESAKDFSRGLLEEDIYIVGTGAAGIPLALELAASG